jgi:hypothetical protein
VNSVCISLKQRNKCSDQNHNTLVSSMPFTLLLSVSLSLSLFLCLSLSVSLCLSSPLNFSYLISYFPSILFLSHSIQYIFLLSLLFLFSKSSLPLLFTLSTFTLSFSSFSLPSLSSQSISFSLTLLPLFPFPLTLFYLYLFSPSLSILPLSFPILFSLYLRYTFSIHFFYIKPTFNTCLKSKKVVIFLLQQYSKTIASKN